MIFPAQTVRLFVQVDFQIESDDYYLLRKNFTDIYFNSSLVSLGHTQHFYKNVFIGVIVKHSLAMLCYGKHIPF